MNDKFVVERVFDAPSEKVWKAFTNPEVLKKWWGPDGFTAPSIKSDFKVGGKYIYCMRGPAGSPWDKNLYSAGEFKEIVPMEKFVVTDYFSDEEGNKTSPIDHGVSADFPDESLVTYKFEDAGDGKTKLTIESPLPRDEKARKAIAESGATEGWSSSLDKLAKLIESNRDEN